MILQTKFSGPAESPGMLLWQTTNAWQSEIRAALAPFNLTHVQFVLLASLVWLESKQPHVSQQQLADLANTDPMMTSQVLRALEARGQLLRRPHPEDGRAKTLQTTAQAKELVNRAVVAVEHCDAKFFGSQGPAFIEVLNRLLHRSEADA